MKYIDHLTNFATASLAAGLGPNEIAIYMRIFWRANEEYWPEYVEISLTEIRQLTNIKSEVTVRKSITNLKQKGFIDFAEFVGKKKKYRLLDLSQYKEIEPPQNLIPPQILTYTPTKNNGVPPQKLTYTPIKNNGVTPCKVPNDGACGGLQDYKTNKTYKTNISDSEKSSDLSKVVEAFTQKIAPSISPLNYEKLADDVKRYGASRVLKAIDRAEQDNKLSLGWVEYLLKNNLEGGKQQYGSKKCSGSAGGNSSADSPTEDDLAYLDVYMQQGPFPWDEGQ